MCWILALNCIGLRFSMEDYYCAGSTEGVLPSDTKQSSQYHCASTGGALCCLPHSSALLIQPWSSVLWGTVGKSSCRTTSHYPTGRSDHGRIMEDTWGSFSCESSFWLHSWHTAQPAWRQLPPRSARMTLLMTFSSPLIEREVEQTGHLPPSEHLLPALSCAHQGNLQICG